MRIVQVSALAVAYFMVWTLTEAASSGGAPQPDLELLEFLGGWQTEDGHSVDPFVLDDMPFPDEASPERTGGGESRLKTEGDRPVSRPSQRPPGSKEDREMKSQRTDDRLTR